MRRKHIMKRRRVFLDMDGTLAEWRKSASVEDLYKPGYFESLRPQRRLVWAVRFVILTGISKLLRIDFYILTSVLPDSQYAEQEKTNWTIREIPELTDKIIFVPYGQSKSKIIGNVTKHDYLIDDYHVNLNQWEGTGVKYLNGINSDWDGPSIKHNSKSMVHDLLRIVMAH